MQFYQWTTDYQLYKKHAPNKRDVLPYKEFLHNRRLQQEAAGIPTHRLYAENVWVSDGSPYYNIHPNLVSRLCKVDMSKIPSTLLQTPHNLRAVNIRFGDKHDEFTMTDRVHTDFVARLSNTSGTTPVGAFVHSVLMLDLRDIGRRPMATFNSRREGTRSVLFLMDFDVYTRLGQPIYSMFSIMPKEGMSLEEAIGHAKGVGRSDSYIGMIENIMRLCVSIGFLADNPSICEPDILSADRSDFQRANEDRKQFLITRARRKGKNGFNIGTDIMFLGERPMGERRQTSELTGRELEYAHIRAGHPHLVRYGEGKKLVKVMWYVPTTVRPDKPFKT